MDTVGAWYTLGLVRSKDCVACAKRLTLSSSAEFRALFLKDTASATKEVQTACKVADASSMRNSANGCIRALAAEYHEVPLEMVIMAVLRILSESTMREFTDPKWAMWTFILGAMLTPGGELASMYQKAQTESRPTRHYQTTMVFANGNSWDAAGVHIFGPLAYDATEHWLGLTEGLLGLIGRQILPKNTFEKMRADFKTGKWAHTEAPTVGEFEGEFMLTLDRLRRASTCSSSRWTRPRKRDALP